MTTVKIDSKLGSNASLGIEDLSARLFAKPGMRVVAIVELAHVERTQPAPDEDKEPSVKLGIKALEVARGGRQEDAVRKTLAALYTIRTASGTLDPEGEVELSERTIEETGGEVTLITAARYQIALKKWSDACYRAAGDPKLTADQLRRELREIAKGMNASSEWSDGD